MSPEQARGKAGRQAIRHLVLRRRAVRDADGHALLRGRDRLATCSPPCLRAGARTGRGCLPDTPPQVRALLGRCLERDPKKRLRDIGDAWLDGAERSGGTRSGRAKSSRRRDGPGSPRCSSRSRRSRSDSRRHAGSRNPRRQRKPPPVHSIVPLPPGTRLTGWASPILAISRDGRTLAFVAEKDGEPQMLWVHRLDRNDTHVVPDSASAEGPFFSPDGQWIGFATNVSQVSRMANGDLRKYSLATGLTQKIADIPDFFGASWAADGSIVVSVSTTEGVWRFPAGGGPPDTSAQTILVQGKPVRRQLWWPQWLTPTDVLVTRRRRLALGRTRRFSLFPPGLVGSREERPVLPLRVQRMPAHVRRDRTLLGGSVRRADGAHDRSLCGRATRGGVRLQRRGGDGRLRERNPRLRERLRPRQRNGPLDVWRASGETGEVEPLPFDAESFGRVPMPSPDGRSLAVITSDGVGLGLRSGPRGSAGPFRSASVRSQGYAVSWSPDGRSIAYSASSEGSQGWGIYRQPADGTGARRGARASRRGGLRPRVPLRTVSSLVSRNSRRTRGSRADPERKKRSREDRRRPGRRGKLFARRAMARL